MNELDKLFINSTTGMRLFFLVYFTFARLFRAFNAVS